MREFTFIENVELQFPAIYTPRKINANYSNAEKYEVVFMPTEKVARKLIDKGIRCGKYGFIASSKFAPVISCVPNQDYNVLVQALEIARARNIPLNQLFRGVKASIVTHEYDYHHPAGGGKALGLSEIVVDADEIFKNASR